MEPLSSFGLVTVLMILFVSATTTANSQVRYEHVALDAVVLLDESGSIDDQEFGQLVDVILKLPETFPVGENEMHLALVHFATKTRIIQQFGYDVDEFKRNLQLMNSRRRQRPKGYTHTYDALKTIRERLLPSDGRKDVANVLILFTDGCPSDKRRPYWQTMKQTEEEAKLLRDTGVIIFLVHVGDKFCEGLPSDKILVEPHQLKMVGNKPSHRIHVNNFAQLTEHVFGQMKEEIKKELCDYVKLCFYDKKRTCSAEWRQAATNSTCIHQKPINKPTCVSDECSSACEDYWLKDKDNCGQFCAAPKTRWCDACRRCEDGQASEAFSKAPTPEAPSAEVPSAEVPTAGASSKGGNKGQPGVKRDPSADGETEKGGSLTWLWILLGVVGCVLLLLAVMISVVVVRRRRNRRKRAEKRAALLRAKENSKSATLMSRSRSRSKSASKRNGESRSRRKSKTRKTSGVKAQQSEFKSSAEQQSNTGHLKSVLSELPPVAYYEMDKPPPGRDASRASKKPSKPTRTPSRGDARASKKPSKPTRAPSRGDARASAGGTARGKGGQEMLTSHPPRKESMNMWQTLPSWKPRKYVSSRALAGDGGPPRSKQVGGRK